MLQPILLASRKSCHSKGNWYLQGGDHHYRFSIFSHQPDWRHGRKPAVAANHDLYAIVAAEPLAGAHLPPSQSFASVSADNVVITAIKKGEEDDSVVVRMVEMDGSDTQAELHFSFPVHGAARTNLIEEDAQSLALAGDVLPVSVGHHAIETFKLFPASNL